MRKLRRWIWVAALIFWAGFGTWLFASLTVTRDPGGSIGAREGAHMTQR